MTQARAAAATTAGLAAPRRADIARPLKESDLLLVTMRRGVAAAAGALLASALVVTVALARPHGGPEAGAGDAAAGWSTRGTTIVGPAGAPFRIAGVTWQGFETPGFVAEGLNAHDYRRVLSAIRRNGFNTVRLPFSSQMWETDPKPDPRSVRACRGCRGEHSRDVLARILNYAGRVGVHVILDNHRSEAGGSAEENGLWYVEGYGLRYPERAWIRDWRQVQRWVHGRVQTSGATDTVRVHYRSRDGSPTVLGYELRNEPHTPPGSGYLQGATWGTGDGVPPRTDPNPNPYAHQCVATSTCHDWRLAAERVGDRLLGDAARNGWALPLLIVDGTSDYPRADGTAAHGPYDTYWWGGQLLGVNGTSRRNPGAPVLFNVGGNAHRLGPEVTNKLVYSAHDFGPEEYGQGWLDRRTCYRSGCSGSSLVDLWTRHWAGIETRGVKPIGNTSPYSSAPVFLGEFGTSSARGDLYPSGRGSQGQWFTDLVHFLASRHRTTARNQPSGVVRFDWSYWELAGYDRYALWRAGTTRPVSPVKLLTFLCTIQRPPLAPRPGSRAGSCGSTGPVPAAR